MEKIYKVLYTGTALKNLEEISSEYIIKILDRIELLETFPMLGQLIIDYFRVVYKINETKKLITIHIVRHCRMNFQ